MMLLRCFTEAKYDELFYNISDNEVKYYEDEGWSTEDFDDKRFFEESAGFEVDKFEPEYVPGEKKDEQKSQEDLQNVKLLYEAFKKLSPLQATNKYMWTYLCHAVPEYRDYIRDRWLSSSHGQTPIQDHFFVSSEVGTAGNIKNLLRKNALSRLWWCGHLTYDEDFADPYELTEILFTNQTVCADVLDTLNRRNPKRLRGLLFAIQEFNEEFGNEGSIIRYVRECNKYLNRYAAVTNLDYLGADEIRKLAFDYMRNLKEQKEQ